MKRIIQLLIGVLLFNMSVCAQIININGVDQAFTEDFSRLNNWGGNWYFPDNTVFNGAFLNPGDSYSTMTLTGSSGAYMRNGNWTGQMDYNIHTPEPGSYSGADVIAGDFDRRAFIYYNLKNECCTNTKNIEIRSSPGVRSTFSFKADNRSATPARIRVDVISSAQAVNPFVASMTPNSSAFFIVTIPGNTVMTFLRTFSGITNVSGFAMRTAGYSGRMLFDDFYVGYALPSDVQISTQPIAGITDVYSGSVISFSGIVNNDDGTGRSDPIFTPQKINYSVINSSGVTSAISSSGTLIITSNVAGTVTVIGASAMDPSKFDTKILTVHPVTSFSIQGPSVFSLPGATFTYSAVPVPSVSGATFLMPLAWTTGPNQFARVNTLTGFFECLGNGTAVLTVSSLLIPGLRTTKNINISGQLEPAGIYVFANPLAINTNGGSLQAGSIIYPPGSDNTVTWTSNNTSVATVDGTGVIQAVNNGVVTITATSVKVSSVTGSIVINVSGQIKVPQPFTETFTSRTGNPWVGDYWGGWPFVPTAFCDLNSQTGDGSLPRDDTTRAFRRGTLPGGNFGVNNELNMLVNIPGPVRTDRQVYYICGGFPWDSGNLRGVNTPTAATKRVAFTVHNRTGSTGTLRTRVSRNGNNVFADGFGGPTMADVTLGPGTTVVNYDLSAVTGGVNNVMGLRFLMGGLVGDVAIDNIQIGWEAATGISAFNPTDVILGSIISTNGVGAGMLAGGRIQLRPTVTPAGADQTGINYRVFTSEGTNPPTLSNDGTITAATNADGAIVVEARPFNTTSIFAYYTVRAYPVATPTDFTLVKSGDISSYMGVTTVSLGSITPASANGLLVYTIIGGGSLATINSQNGVLMANGSGNGTVTVRGVSLVSGTLRRDITVNITGQRPISISITAPSTLINQPLGVLHLSAAITPFDVPQAISWSSSFPSLAEVSPNGIVVGKGNGVVTITAIATNNSSVRESVVVTITGQPIITDVVFTSTQSVVNTPKGQFDIGWQVVPGNASQNVIWSVTPNDAARVDGGRFTALKNGTVTVTARSEVNPSISNSFTVTMSNQQSPVFAKGYFFDNFVGPSPDNTSYGATYEPSRTKVRSVVRNNGFLIVNYDNTTGGAAENWSVGSFRARFGQPIAKQYNATTAGIRFTVLSSQAILLRVMFSTNEFTLDPGPRAMSRNINLVPGLNNIRLDFGESGATVENGWTWNSNPLLYFSINPWSGVAKGAGSLTFLGLSLGYEVDQVNIFALNGQSIPGINSSGRISSRGGTVTFTGIVTGVGAPLTATGWANQEIDYTLIDPNGLAKMEGGVGEVQALGVGNGSVTISGTTFAYPFKTVYGVITITGNDPIQINTLSLSFKTVTTVTSTPPVLAVGHVLTVLPIYSPSANVVPDFVYSVDDPSVAFINSETGRLVALANGQVRVSVNHLYTPSLVRTADITISTPIQSFVVTSSGFLIREFAGSMQMGISRITPAAAVFSGIEWSVDKPEIAVIDGAGLLQARGNGVVVVTAKIGDVTASRTISIINQPSSVSETQASKLVVYPNPIKGGTAQVSSKENPILGYSVIDASGKLIHRVSVSASEAIKLDVGALQKGSYMVLFDTRLGVIIKTVVVE